MVDIEVSGTLTPRMDAGQSRLLLCDAAGASVLTYSKLVAYDATGRTLPSAMALSGAGRTIRLTVDDTGARYPVVVDPMVQAAKLTASDAAADDYFGKSVSISGDLAIVGAYLHDDSGSAFIFSKDQGGTDNWGEVKRLTASDAANMDYFGCSVSISGGLAIVGAYRDGNYSGSAYIFSKDQGGTDNWGGVQKLTAWDAAGNDYFGYSVSISGDLAILGAYGNVDAGIYTGSAYIFSKDHGGTNVWLCDPGIPGRDGAIRCGGPGQPLAG